MSENEREDARNDYIEWLEMVHGQIVLMLEPDFAEKDVEKDAEDFEDDYDKVVRYNVKS